MKEQDRINKRVDDLKDYFDNIEFIEKLIREVDTLEMDDSKAASVRRKGSVKRKR